MVSDLLHHGRSVCYKVYLCLLTETIMGVQSVGVVRTRYASFK